MRALLFLLVAGCAGSGSGPVQIKNLVVDHQSVAAATCASNVETYTLTFTLTANQSVTRLTAIDIAPLTKMPIGAFSSCAGAPWTDFPSPPIQVSYEACPSSSTTVAYDCGGSLNSLAYFQAASSLPSSGTLTLTLHGDESDNTSWNATASASF
jgi:hypothetical protein